MQARSPAIDTGDNTAVPADTADLDGDNNTTEPTPLDLDRNPRFVDDPQTTPDTGNGTPPIVDMGAYEFQVAPIPTLSQWGLVGLTLGLVTAASLVFRRRRVDNPFPHPGAPGRSGLRPLGALLGTLAWTSVASAQVDVGEQIRVDTPPEPPTCDAAANETSIASSNANPLEIVAAWNDLRDSLSCNPAEDEVILRMGVAVSMDGGVIWEDDDLIRPPATFQTDFEGDPMTAYDDRTGTLWVGAIAWKFDNPEKYTLFVARKLPGQNTFQPSVVVESGPVLIDKPWMAAGPAHDNLNATNLYIAYGKQLNPGERFSGVVATLPDADIDTQGNWGSPVPIGAFGIGFLPRVGPNGELYVVYHDREPPNNDKVLLKRSFDGGASFEVDPITVATRKVPWEAAESGRFPGDFKVATFNHLAVDQNDGTLYCVYFDADPEECQSGGSNCNVDLYFTKSTDQGTCWTTPVVINGDNVPPVLPGDQFFPWIEVDQAGNLHMVFLDSRNTVQDDGDIHSGANAMLDAYYSFSADGGAHWEEFRLTKPPDGPFESINDGVNLDHEEGGPTGHTTQLLGDYLGLGRGGSRAYPCYLSTQNGDPDIFMHVVTTDKGACCFATGSCSVMTPASCGGSFLGLGTSCTSLDCQPNDVDDECDIAAGTSCDIDENGVPDECEGVVPEPPQAEMLGEEVSAKNRYISVTAGTAGRSQAIRVRFVTLPPPFDVWEFDHPQRVPCSKEARAKRLQCVSPLFSCGFRFASASATRCRFTQWDPRACRS